MLASMYMPFAPHFAFLLGTLAMLLFWAGVVALAVWAVRAYTSRPATGPVAPAVQTPRQILDERLVRGDISVQDYEKIKAALEKE